MYEPFFYSIKNPQKATIKILYFTLEMSKEDKMNEFFCHLLYKLDRIRISPTTLKSTDEDDPCPEEILELLESDKYQEYITKFEEYCEYVDTERNPTGISKYCENYALTHGHNVYKDYEVTLPDGRKETRSKIDYYVPDNPEETVIVILDNFSNLMQEQGMNKMTNIEKMSKSFIIQRDRYEFCIVGIQHQAQAQEGIENQKLGKMMPSSDGLADCKTTTRDANLVLGLYSPFKYGLQEYMGYDITTFRNQIRFLHVLEDRDNGSGGQICPLFFDGAVSTFVELPLPTNRTEITQVMDYINREIRGHITTTFMGISIRKARISKTKSKLQKLKKFFSFAYLKKKREEWQKY